MKRDGAGFPAAPGRIKLFSPPLGFKINLNDGEVLPMYKKIAVACLSLILFSACAARLAAQAAPSGRASGASQGDQGQKGLSLRVAFEGSSSQDGQVFDLNTSTGYTFNKFFGVDVGLPIYFVRPSSTAPTPGSGTAKSSSGAIGNVYTGAHLTLDNPLLAYSTSATLTMPSGDIKKGRSTGHVTYDWDNRVDHEFFGRLTPYVDAGLANSISDTRFFKRPFITYGKLAHFEAGTDVQITKMLTFTASAYDIAPWGQQTVISRFVQRGSGGTGGPVAARHGRVFETQPATVGTADLTRDNGYSAGVTLNPSRVVDFGVGYTRSVPLHLDTVSFSVGVNVSRLLQHGTK